jgi:hypothetical protein
MLMKRKVDNDVESDDEKLHNSIVFMQKQLISHSAQQQID